MCGAAGSGKLNLGTSGRYRRLSEVRASTPLHRQVRQGVLPEAWLLRSEGWNYVLISNAGARYDQTSQKESIALTRYITRRPESTPHSVEHICRTSLAHWVSYLRVDKVPLDGILEHTSMPNWSGMISTMRRPVRWATGKAQRTPHTHCWTSTISYII